MTREQEGLVGTTIAGRYRLQHVLGEGAAAVVFLAHDTKHTRDVAVKILRPEVAAALGGARFEREIMLSARLSHPHIVPMLDAGEADGRLYYVMPVLQGASLRDRLTQQGQLSFDETLQIARDVALALDYAHAQGIIHRDIKPENVLIGGGTAVVADFGVAKVVSDGSSPNSLTRTGFALGTVLYMSPEQSTAAPVDARSDLYALGCMVYEMLAGEPPFTGPNPQAVLAKHFTDPVPSVRRLRPALPMGVDEAIAKAMAKTPADRFATAGEFAAELARIRNAGATSLSATGFTPPSANARPPARMSLRRRLALAAAAGAGLAGIAAGVVAIGRRSAEPPAAAVTDGLRSIAVLPFDDVSPNKDQEYFATGIADELVTALARLPNLRIAARTSSFALRNSNLQPQEIGRRLRVSALLTGSIAKDGNRLRIRTELVDVAADSVLWRESFDKEMQDVFAVQEEIAQTVVSRLRVLGGATDVGTRHLVGVATTDTAAYVLYLRGRLAWNRRTAASLREAVDYFTRAIGNDPNYARAWAGLADTYNVIGLNFYGHPGDNFRLGRDAALKAISLDSTLAEAHAALASAQAFLDRDWDAADASYRTAIRLDPTYPATYYFYSIFLTSLGRFDEGIANARKAHDLDPSSSALAQGVGMAYLYSRRPAESIEPLRLAISLQPRYYFPHAWYAIALARQHQRDSAIAQAREAVRLAPDNVLVRSFLGQTFALVGERDSALAEARALEALRPTQAVPNVMLARLYGILGDRERALAAIDRGIEMNEAQVAQLRVPGFESLEGDPRYEAILRRMKLK